MGIIFPIISFPYVSRILSPEGIGRINFTNSIVSYFTLFAGLGISSYGIREASKVRDNKNNFSLLVKELVIINLVSVFISYILFFSVLFFVPELYSYRSLLLVASLTIFFSTLGVEWVYSALEEYRYIAIRAVLFQVLSLSCMFIFVKTREDIIDYLSLTILGSVGANVCNIINLRKYVAVRTVGVIKIKKHLKPIFTMFGMALITSVYTMLDTTMLGFLANDTQVGYYSAATKINKIVLSVVTSASIVLFPRLSIYADKEDKKNFHVLLNRSLSTMMFFAVPATVGLNLLSEPIMLVFSGVEYIPAIPVMMVMNPIIIIIGLSNFIGIQCLVPLKKEKITLYSVVLGAITNFSLNLILIKKYAALGAAISTLVAESVVTLFQLIMARKYLDIDKIIRSIWQYCIASILMGIVIYTIKKFFTSNMLIIIISLILGAIIYFLVLIMLKNEFMHSLKKKVMLAFRGNNEKI